MRDDWVILHGGALGDLVLTLHLAFSIDELCNSVGLYVISRIDLRPLTSNRPPLQWRSPDALRTHWLFRDDDAPPPGELAALIGGRRVLSCLGDVDSHVHMRLRELGAREVLSMDPRPMPADARHITVQWQDQIARQNGGLGFRAAPPPLLHLAERRQGSGRPGIGSGAARVLIHPGGGGFAKQWPLDSFIALARLILERGDAVRFALGPVEHERFPEWRQRLSQVAPVSNCTTLASLSNELDAATLFIGNDSGPGHAAAAMGVPTLTLFGPTQAAVWHPLGPACRFLQGDSALHEWGLDVQAVLRAATNEPIAATASAHRSASRVTTRRPDGLIPPD